MSNLVCGAGGILLSQNSKKILVIRENETNLTYGKEAGMLSIPMGRIEPGEKPEEAVKREMKEETGLDVKIVAFIKLFFIPGAKIWIYKVELGSNITPTAGKLNPFWISIEQLRKYSFVRPPTNEVVHHVLTI